MKGLTMGWKGSGRRRRTVLRGAAALAVVALPALAPPTAAEAAPLRFAPCAERAQAGWECATLTVPLDHSGAVPGTLELRVQRLAHDGPPRGKALVNIEGGPGASTTARSEQTRRLLGEVTARNGYDLILLDTRATGASRPQQIPLGSSRHYSTAATVRDLELMRQGLGIERLALMGTSYSTLYVTEFARTFPERTDRVIADSPVGPAGPDHFGAATAAAALPVLRDVCRRSACPGGPTAVARDLDRLIARAKRGLFWIPSAMVWKGRMARGGKMGVQPGTVLAYMIGADEATANLALLPIMLRDAARGDWRAFGRRVGMARESVPPINPDITRITRCLDTRVPWPFEAPVQQRAAPAKALQQQVPTEPLEPWDPGLLRRGQLWSCVGFGPSGLPGAIKGGAVPDVPGVILQGAWDLRTPPEDGRALAGAWPSATLVVAPATGHGVLRAATACASRAVDALLAGRRAAADACAGWRAVAEPLLVGSRPEDLRALPGAPSAVAKTAFALLATVRDAEVAVAAAAPRGGSAELAGVAGGFARATRTVGGPTRIRLLGYALQDGLPLDGTVTIRSPSAYAAELRLSGRHAGSVRIAGGRLTGTLDGERLDLRLRGPLARPAVWRLG